MPCWTKFRIKSERTLRFREGLVTGLRRSVTLSNTGEFNNNDWGCAGCLDSADSAVCGSLAAVVLVVIGGEERGAVCRTAPRVVWGGGCGKFEVVVVLGGGRECGSAVAGTSFAV